MLKRQHDERRDAPATPLRGQGPGTQTTPSTLVNAARAWGGGATRRNDATSGKVPSGISVVASAIAPKPWSL
jgi:hypothetical protein